MKIGLVDCDDILKARSFENLTSNIALMKLSSYHKQLGDSVEFFRDGERYDRVYISKIFSYSPTPEHSYYDAEVIMGGALDPFARLPRDVEESPIDYELYGLRDTAIVRTTLGCPRRCKFCCVSSYEGDTIRRTNEIKNSYTGQKDLHINDSNLLGYSDHISCLDEIFSCGAERVHFSTFDIRLITRENIEYISRAYSIGFAWDSTYEDLQYQFEVFKNELENRGRGLENVWVNVLIDNGEVTDVANDRRFKILSDLGYSFLAVKLIPLDCRKLSAHRTIRYSNDTHQFVVKNYSDYLNNECEKFDLNSYDDFQRFMSL